MVSWSKLLAKNVALSSTLNYQCGQKEPEGLNNDRSFNCRTSVLQTCLFFNNGLWCQPTILLLHIEIHFDLNLVGRLRNHGVSSQFVHVAYTCCNSKSSSKPMEISQMLPVPLHVTLWEMKNKHTQKKDHIASRHVFVPFLDPFLELDRDLFITYHLPTTSGLSFR